MSLSPRIRDLKTLLHGGGRRLSTDPSTMPTVDELTDLLHKQDVLYEEHTGGLEECKAELANVVKESSTAMKENEMVIEEMWKHLNEEVPTKCPTCKIEQKSAEKTEERIQDLESRLRVAKSTEEGAVEAARKAVLIAQRLTAENDALQRRANEPVVSRSASNEQSTRIQTQITQIQQLQETNGRLNSEISGLKNELFLMKEQLKTATNSLEQMNLAKARFQKQHAELKTEKHALQLENDSLRRDNSSSTKTTTQQISTLTASLSALESQSNIYKNERDDHQARLTVLHSENCRLISDLATSHGLAATYHSQLVQMRAQLTEQVATASRVISQSTDVNNAEQQRIIVSQKKLIGDLTDECERLVSHIKLSEKETSRQLRRAAEHNARLVQRADFTRPES